MKQLLALAVLVLVGNVLVAQEKFSDEEAKGIAKTLAKHGADVKAPFKVDVDEEKPFGLKDGDYGAMILPARKLSAEVIGKAGKDIVPIGQFWMKMLTPQVGGKALGNDKLNVVKVKHNDQEVSLTMYIIGVRKGEKGLEAVVYTKDKEPILVAPLEKSDTKPTNPIEFEAKKGDESATLTFVTVGGHKFQFTIVRQQE